MILADTLLPAALARTAFAGFWRRLGAFAIDAFILAAVGQILGLALFDALVRLGPWGRVFGFLVAFAYFVPQESRIGGGQTPGKRLLRIRVVDARGAPLDPRRAAARFTVFGVPWFINGAVLPMSVATFAGGVPVALLSFGAVLALGYLLVFNRRTRQSLHDLATGTYVLRADDAGHAPVPAVRVWSGHLVIVAMLFLLTGALPLAMPQLIRMTLFADLKALYDQVAAQPGVQSVSVFEAVTTRYGVHVSSKQRVLLIQVTTGAPVVDANPLATRLAGIALAAWPGAGREDAISVRLARGFDIGIASNWDSNEIVFTPDQWRDRVDAGVGGQPSAQ